MKVLVFLLSFFQFCISIDQLSQNYKIPSYYGSRFQDFLLQGNVIKGQLTSFYWFQRAYQSGADFYYSDQQRHAIWKINEQKGYKELVAGTLDQAGYRDGDFFNSQFNKPSGIVYIQSSKLEIAREQTKKTIVLKNNSTGNYLWFFLYQLLSACIVTNIILLPAMILILLLKQMATIATTYLSTLILIKQKIYISLINVIIIFKENIATESSLQDQLEDPFIYIADQGNHCIRKLDLKNSISQTIAGQCGLSGFKDGQLGVSLLNQPTFIGVDPLGTVFFYDSGNKYIRIISTEGIVYTLLGGACREDVRFSPLHYQSLKIRRVLCYRDWIKTSGEPSEHLLTQADNMTVCTEHYTDCPDEI